MILKSSFLQAQVSGAKGLGCKLALRSKTCARGETQPEITLNPFKLILIVSVLVVETLPYWYLLTL
jgi:hypothetical protein